MHSSKSCGSVNVRYEPIREIQARRSNGSLFAGAATLSALYGHSIRWPMLQRSSPKTALARMGFISVFAFTTLFPFGFKTTKKHRLMPLQAIDLGKFRA
jgi:hypothetical protein